MSAASLKQNKWVRRSVVAILALLGFWGLAWLAVPPIAKSQIQKIASEKLGRQVTLGKVDFKPWSLEVTLSDLHVATADGSRSQFSVGRIYADAELQSIVRLAPVVDAVTIEAPAVLLTHLADGQYDIDDILAKFAAAPDEPPADGEPPRFAVYNIRISGGSVEFDDQTVGSRHELRDFVLDVPFLSNLPSQRDIQTEPRLAFVLNGSRFDSSAQSTPFAESRKTDVQLDFEGLDLAPYLGYIPAGLPVALREGRLDAKLKVDFEQAATTGLKVTGSVDAHAVKLADAQGRDLLNFDSLHIGLADVRPLERIVHLGEVSLAAPQLVVARDAAGRLNLLPAEAANEGDSATDKAPAPAAAEDAASTPTPQAPPGWRVQVDKVALTGGQVGWRDEAVAPAAAIDLKALGIDASGVTWPMEQPAKFSGSATVEDAAIRFSGEATDKAATVQTEVEALPLSLAAPYLAQSLEPTLDGKLSGQIEVAWAQPALKFKARRVAAEGLALTEGKTAVASVGRFELADAEVDMTAHTLAIGAFTATNPKVHVERDSEKRWMFERWMKVPAAGGSAPAQAKVAAPGKGSPADAEAKPWKLTIGAVNVDNGTLSYADKAGARPVAFEVSTLKVEAKNIAPNTATASPLNVSGRIGTGPRARAGRFAYQGNVVLEPVSAEGRLNVSGFPAHAFESYYAEALNVDIRRAYASYRGTVRFATTPQGMRLGLKGDTAVEDFRADSATLTQSAGLDNRSSQLLRWKVLDLRGLQVAMAPGAPPRVDVRETTLTDFFARVIVDPTGRLNLQNLTKKSQEEAEVAQGEAVSRRSLGGTTTTTLGGAAPPAPSGRPVPAEEMMGGGAEAAAPPPAAKAPAAEPEGPQPVINFGPMRLVNGRIDFSDLFVKPNYSADLSELTGSLSAFSSQPQGERPALADLELRGKAQQTAALEITGKLNPLAKPLELDITAQMRDLDLPPLSPYSVRYAGHGIERGKLSMDVSYKIAPDGQLTATNKLVLNQLQFGDAVEGAPNSLPVRMAVALLADRNGVIDVDLPLSGSLNDPQFSIGPLIFKAIVNLVVKAVTAPFSLLTGGLGGGGGESSAITFEPGSAALSPQARENLDKVAKALTDRPGLRMTVVGTASLEREREAYQRLRLRELTQAEKRRETVRRRQDPGTVPAVTDEEYPKLLEAVYDRADIKKPRNLIGLAKNLPVKEMEDLLLASISVDEETMRRLAVARGAAVRDYLLAQELSSERLFLGAARTRAEGTDWKPAAELELDTR